MLRLQADGQATEAIEFDRGAAPERFEMTTVKSQRVTGQLLTENGQPMANTPVVVTGKADEDGQAVLIDYTRTDNYGNWSADVLPNDATGVTAHLRFKQ
ncbi:MAG: hypothetical protein R3F19_00100 [Verrucomicrobiales bacterium]